MHGLWVTSSGLAGADSGCGIAVGAINGSQFKVGIAVVASAVVSQAFRDDSSAVTSLLIQGSHSYGIDLNGATISSYGQRFGNSMGVAWRNQAGGADINHLFTNTSNHLVLGDGTTLLVDSGNHRVGMGTSSPQTGVHVVAANATLSGVYNTHTLGLSTGTAQAADRGASLALGGLTDSAGTIRAFAAITGRKLNGTDTNTSGYMGLWTHKTGVGLREWLRIDPDGLFTFTEAAGLVFGTTTGTKIGTATSQKIGFHNATPVVQRVGAAQAAVGTTAATQTTPFGYTTAAQADAIVTLVNEIRAALVEKGLIKGAA